MQFECVFVIYNKIEDLSRSTTKSNWIHEVTLWCSGNNKNKYWGAFCALTGFYLNDQTCSELLEKYLRISNKRMYGKQESLSAFCICWLWIGCKVLVPLFLIKYWYQLLLLDHFAYWYSSSFRSLLKDSAGNVLPKARVINMPHIPLPYQWQFCNNLPSAIFHKFLLLAGWSYNHHTNERISNSNWWGVGTLHKTFPQV